MQKKLIALAIAGVIAAPAAMAADSSVTIYGQLDMSIDLIDTDDQTVGADTDLRRVSSNSSRIGFKGKEDLGNGMFASWQIEQSIGMESAGGTFATRNTYVGLGGNFGEVRMGRHDTPHKMSTAKLDVFADTAGDYNTIVGNANGTLQFDNRTANTIAYLSPNFSGFSAAVAYVMGAGIETDNNTVDNNSATSLGLMYENGPIYVGYGYEKLSNVAGATDLTDNKLGVGFAGDGFKVGLVYDKMSDNSGDTANDRSAWLLNGQINAGPGAVKIAYGKANDGKTVADTKATNWVLGYDYPMSKRTKLYALYSKTTNSSGATYDIAQGQGANLGTVAVGEDPSVWSFGVRHTF